DGALFLPPTDTNDGALFLPPPLTPTDGVLFLPLTLMMEHYSSHSDNNDGAQSCLMIWNCIWLSSIRPTTGNGANSRFWQ
ncbi:unnamed protein product, partial [Staurois parvus]